MTSNLGGFDLRKNPFYLLGVSPRDKSEALSIATEEAIASGKISEHTAIALQQTLMASRSRLDAEVGWLMEIAPGRIASIIEAISKSDVSYISIISSLPNLAKANAAAHICAQRKAGIEILRELIKCQDEIDTSKVGDAVNADRRVSGFPQVDASLLNQALKGLLDSHVVAALAFISKSRMPSELTAAIANEFISAKTAQRDFVEEIIRRYDATAVSHIQQLAENIRHKVRKYGDTNSADDLKQIEESFQLWRKETEAQRILASSRKLDEPHSAELFKSIRELCKTLMGENVDPERVRTIFHALQSAFADVPSVSDQVDRDIKELADISTLRKFQAAAGPFIAALEEAKRDLTATALEIAQRGFGPNSQGVVGRLYTGFKQAASGLENSEHAAVPWNVLRQLAVELNNTEQAPREAEVIVNVLLSVTEIPIPPNIAKGLAEDKRKLTEINLTAILTTQMKAGNLKGALETMKLLEPITNEANDLKTIRDLRSTVEGKLLWKRIKLIGWGAFAPFILYFVFFSDHNSSPNRTTTYSQPAANPTQETIPPPSSGRILSLTELRYCLFQTERIRRIRNALPVQPPDYEIDLFNNMVDDLNSRCTKNRYYDADENVVKANIAAYGSLLDAQAMAIIRKWNGQ